MGIAAEVSTEPTLVPLLPADLLCGACSPPGWPGPIPRPPGRHSEACPLAHTL
jgi:hypothetical protein